MQNEVLREHLDNVTLIDQKPRSEQLDFLNASDVIMISLISGMTGAGVPSRMYNAMAAGKPIIAIAEPQSELALVVKEEEVGWVIPPEQPAELADVIRDLRMHSEKLSQMGIRAREAAVQKYAPDKIIKLYSKLLEDLK
jgi:colanic acid biosynthesis glycosyl transferase WcaI